MTDSNIISLSPPPVAVSSPEVVMEPVDRVKHSELSLLHSRPTTITNWIHLPEPSADDGTFLLPSCARSRPLALA